MTANQQDETNSFDKSLNSLLYASDYATKSEMVRDALRTLMVTRRRAQLRANLQRYLQDQQALAEAADEVEARMAVTEEALEQAE